VSGRPSCLPPREEILGFVGGALAAPEKWVVEEQADNLDAVIVGAVEQALAEQEAENAKLKKSSDLALSLAEEFERAVASREPVHGMQVTTSGDFIACAQLPSAVKRMAWWAREIRAARAEVDKP